MQRGFAPILVLLAIMLSGLILLVPIPAYSSNCLMIYGTKCKGGWYLGDPLWKRLLLSYYSLKEENKQPIPLPTLRQNDGWEVYTNQQLGLEFRYPKDLKVQKDSEEEFNKRGNGDFRKNFKDYVGYEPGKFLGGVVVLGKDNSKDNSYDTNPFALWVFDNPNDLTIDAWYKQYWYYPFVWGDFTYTGKFTLAPKDEATISGQMAKFGIVDYQPGKPKFIYLSKDRKMYLFRIIGENGDKILQSFKLN